MSIEEKVPMNRTSITIVVVVLLCAVGFAYSQGWFDWSSPGIEWKATVSAPIRRSTRRKRTRMPCG